MAPGVLGEKIPGEKLTRGLAPRRPMRGPHGDQCTSLAVESRKSKLHRGHPSPKKANSVAAHPLGLDTDRRHGRELVLLAEDQIADLLAGCLTGPRNDVPVRETEVEVCGPGH